MTEVFATEAGLMQLKRMMGTRTTGRASARRLREETHENRYKIEGF
jgi:hypothetical protein